MQQAVILVLLVAVFTSCVRSSLRSDDVLLASPALGEATEEGAIPWTVHEDGSRELRDADIAAVFPQLASSPRLRTCGEQHHPFIRYTPKIITSNVVRSRHLSCVGDPDLLLDPYAKSDEPAQCVLTEAVAYYDDDPKTYFELVNIGSEEAFALVRQLRAGEYEPLPDAPPAWRKPTEGVRITRISKTSSRHYQVEVGECFGCSGELFLSSTSDQEPEALTLIANSMACM